MKIMFEKAFAAMIDNGKIILSNKNRKFRISESNDIEVYNIGRNPHWTKAIIFSDELLGFWQILKRGPVEVIENLVLLTDKKIGGFMANVILDALSKEGYEIKEPPHA